MDKRGGNVHNRHSQGALFASGLITRRLARDADRPARQADQKLPPMTTFQPSVACGLAQFVADARRRVDEELGRLLPKAGDDPEFPCPARLAAAMRYSVLGGG